MNFKLRQKIKKIPKAIKNPRRSIALLLRYISPKDSEIHRIGKWSYGKIPRLPITEVLPGIEKVDITLVRAYDRLIDTSLDIQEIMALSAIVRFTNSKNILEIGTYNGNTALNLAANSAADALVTTLDLPPDWNGQFELKVHPSHLNVTEKAEVGLQYKDTKYSKKIIQLFSDSAKLDWSKLPIPFDIVFIDGCHSYEYGKKDTQNAMRYLKSGSILIWHDYGFAKDVSKVVDETAKKIKVRAIRGTRLAVGFIE